MWLKYCTEEKQSMTIIEGNILIYMAGWQETRKRNDGLKAV